MTEPLPSIDADAVEEEVIDFIDTFALSYNACFEDREVNDSTRLLLKNLESRLVHVSETEISWSSISKLLVAKLSNPDDKFSCHINGGLVYTFIHCLILLCSTLLSCSKFNNSRRLLEHSIETLLKFSSESAVKEITVYSLRSIEIHQPSNVQSLPYILLDRILQSDHGSAPARNIQTLSSSGICCTENEQVLLNPFIHHNTYKLLTRFIQCSPTELPASSYETLASGLINHLLTNPCSSKNEDDYVVIVGLLASCIHGSPRFRQCIRKSKQRKSLFKVLLGLLGPNFSTELVVRSLSALTRALRGDSLETKVFEINNATQTAILATSKLLDVREKCKMSIQLDCANIISNIASSPGLISLIESSGLINRFLIEAIETFKSVPNLTSRDFSLSRFGPESSLISSENWYLEALLIALSNIVSVYGIARSVLMGHLLGTDQLESLESLVLLVFHPHSPTSLAAWKLIKSLLGSEKVEYIISEDPKSLAFITALDDILLNKVPSGCCNDFESRRKEQLFDLLIGKLAYVCMCLRAAGRVDVTGYRPNKKNHFLPETDEIKLTEIDENLERILRLGRTPFLKRFIMEQDQDILCFLHFLICLSQNCPRTRLELCQRISIEDHLSPILDCMMTILSEDDHLNFSSKPVEIVLLVGLFILSLCNKSDLVICENQNRSHRDPIRERKQVDFGRFLLHWLSQKVVGLVLGYAVTQANDKNLTRQATSLIGQIQNLGSTEMLLLSDSLFSYAQKSAENIGNLKEKVAQSAFQIESAAFEAEQYRNELEKAENLVQKEKEHSKKILYCTVAKAEENLRSCQSQHNLTVENIKQDLEKADNELSRLRSSFEGCQKTIKRYELESGVREAETSKLRETLQVATKQAEILNREVYRTNEAFLSAQRARTEFELQLASKMTLIEQLQHEKANMERKMQNLHLQSSAFQEKIKQEESEKKLASKKAEESFLKLISLAKAYRDLEQLFENERAEFDQSNAVAQCKVIAAQKLVEDHMSKANEAMNLTNLRAMEIESVKKRERDAKEKCKSYEQELQSALDTIRKSKNESEIFTRQISQYKEEISSVSQQLAEEKKIREEREADLAKLQKDFEKHAELLKTIGSLSNAIS